MKIRPTFLTLVVLTLGASIAVAQPGGQPDAGERKYRVIETDRCPPDSPWAVVLLKSSEDDESDADEDVGTEKWAGKREILECHPTEDAARQHVADLKASGAGGTEEAQNGASAPATAAEQDAAVGQPPTEPTPAGPAPDAPALAEPAPDAPSPDAPAHAEPAPIEAPVAESASAASAPEPSPTSTPTATEAATATATATATSSVDSGNGLFILKCGSSHLAQVDPIVAPGGASAHLHEFFGNRSTDASSTYQSMVAAGTTCPLPADTAAYWSPALIGPDGNVVRADGISAYYRNDPVRYAATVPFPPDFRMIAGGVGSPPAVAFWSCKNEGIRYTSPPKCDASTFPRAIVHFPQCWDGVRIDSPDHRSHVAYPRRDVCPSTHPVKLPHIKLYVRYPQSVGGPGYVLSDGMTAVHADFWNTWQQPALEELVVRCFNAGIDCGRQG